jgi:hypothetical protein
LVPRAPTTSRWISATSSSQQVPVSSGIAIPV